MCCKYNCKDGKLFDINTKSWILCPECRGKRLREVEDSADGFSDVFGIDGTALSGVLVPEAIIPENESEYLEPESFDTFSDTLKSLFGSLSLGKPLKGSYCFGLGVKGRVGELAYPLLKAGYGGGLSVSKFVTAIGLSQMLLKQTLPEEVLTSDLCIILVNEGCSKADVSACKGIMQERASNGKGTVFVTTWSVEACSNLLGYSDGEDLFLAKPVFVRYRYGEKHSSYINNLFGVENSLPELNF